MVCKVLLVLGFVGFLAAATAVASEIYKVNVTRIRVGPLSRQQLKDHH